MRIPAKALWFAIGAITGVIAMRGFQHVIVTSRTALATSSMNETSVGAAAPRQTIARAHADHEIVDAGSLVMNLPQTAPRAIDCASL